jgi:hypothetical protein
MSGNNFDDQQHEEPESTREYNGVSFMVQNSRVIPFTKRLSRR